MTMPLSSMRLSERLQLTGALFRNARSDIDPPAGSLFEAIITSRGGKILITVAAIGVYIALVTYAADQGTALITHLVGPRP